MSNLPSAIKKAPDGLAYHVAINKDSENCYDKKGNKLPPLFTDEEICSDYDITVEELWELKRDPEFRKSVLLCLRDIKENGDSVRLQQRQMFQHYSAVWYPELFNTECGEHVAEKNKALATMAKVGGVELAVSSKELPNAGTTVNAPGLTIIMQQAPAAIQQSQGEIIDVK